MVIEVLHGGHVACQEQFNIIPVGQNVHSNAKHFHCSWHATCPPCKTSITIVSIPHLLSALKGLTADPFIKYF